MDHFDTILQQFELCLLNEEENIAYTNNEINLKKKLKILRDFQLALGGNAYLNWRPIFIYPPNII